MKSVTIKIPEKLAKELETHEVDLREVLLTGLSYVKAREALDFYKRGLISFARAAEIADLPRLELIRLARASGIKPLYDKEMIKEELRKKK